MFKACCDEHDDEAQNQGRLATAEMLKRLLTQSRDPGDVFVGTYKLASGACSMLASLAFNEMHGYGGKTPMRSREAVEAEIMAMLKREMDWCDTNEPTGVGIGGQVMPRQTDA